MKFLFISNYCVLGTKYINSEYLLNAHSVLGTELTALQGGIFSFNLYKPSKMKVLELLSSVWKKKLRHRMINKVAKNTDEYVAEPGTDPNGIWHHCVHVTYVRVLQCSKWLFWGRGAPRHSLDLISYRQNWGSPLKMHPTPAPVRFPYKKFDVLYEDMWSVRSSMGNCSLHKKEN